MDFNRLFPTLFFVIVAIVLLNVVVLIIRKGGFRGAMFGARVASTAGEIDLGRKGTVHTRVKVHRLESDGAAAPRIGIEIRSTSFAGFAVRGIPLTREQATRLGTLLLEASR